MASMSVTFRQYWPSQGAPVGSVVGPRVALDQLHQVAVGVEDERDRHRPLLEPLRLGLHLGAGGEGGGVGGGDVAAC